MNDAALLTELRKQRQQLDMQAAWLNEQSTLVRHLNAKVDCERHRFNSLLQSMTDYVKQTTADVAELKQRLAACEQRSSWAETFRTN